MDSEVVETNMKQFESIINIEIDDKLSIEEEEINIIAQQLVSNPIIYYDKFNTFELTNVDISNPIGVVNEIAKYQDNGKFGIATRFELMNEFISEIYNSKEQILGLYLYVIGRVDGNQLKFPVMRQLTLKLKEDEI